MTLLSFKTFPHYTLNVGIVHPSK